MGAGHSQKRSQGKPEINLNGRKINVNDFLAKINFFLRKHVNEEKII